MVGQILMIQVGTDISLVGYTPIFLFFTQQAKNSTLVGLSLYLIELQ
jgi:hypothetical protein